MFNSNFEFITTLQYRVKSLTARVQAFESGEKYISMRKQFNIQLDEKNRDIRKLKLELADANCCTVTVRKNWQQVLEDIENDHAKVIRDKDREIELLQKKLWETEDNLADSKGELRKKAKELYGVMAELEEEKGKNQKLTAQINRDYKNSSISSSLKTNRKKITNNRVKTGKKPGGQPGHKGHVRKRQVPTEVIVIKPPDEYLNNPNYELTKIEKKRQMVGINVVLNVKEYVSLVYRHKKTKQLIHAEFPEGLDNDVNYDSSIKAFAFLLNNHCNASIDKVREFMSDITGGALEISKGMINGLSREFSKKSEAEQRNIFSNLVGAPVLNEDFTTARVNGKNVNVFCCATPNEAAYFAREHKGHEGVKGTPAELNANTHVHDHDITFYSYGRLHQECLVHILRYLLNSIENEKNLTWSTRMRALIQEMIHYRNCLEAEEDFDADKVKEFENRYNQILDIAKKEYEFEPPTKFYKQGYNLSLRLREYRDACLLFLHDKSVPPDNNICERLLRVFKRKMKQVMAFRSFDSLEYLCQSMTVMALLRAKNNNFYSSIADVFAC
ncbi:MAG: transposase [Streptococcaceae bacterium]|jgi:hypothetical protein|nr:transposase [Streptococcaceae bacterium]